MICRLPFLILSKNYKVLSCAKSMLFRVFPPNFIDTFTAQIMERISWDEATEIIVNETRRIQQTWGHESVVTYMGTGREAVIYGYPFSIFVLNTPTSVTHNPDGPVWVRA